MASLETNIFIKALRKCLFEDEYYAERIDNILAERIAEKEKANGQKSESVTV